MRTAIVNLGGIVSGDLETPTIAGDAILMDGGVIEAVGSVPDSALKACDVVIDADGAIAAPGLIDSHVHITFGDYTPRQRTVGFLESYTHGGITTAITASEVHTPGRPKDREGVKALAVAALKCFEHFRPGGMRVLAGSVILEPGLEEADFAELARKGVKLAKAGFGAFSDPIEYAPYVQMAKRHGMITTMHTGGSSIPGSAGIWAKHVKAADPHVSFHVNGGPVAMPDEDFPVLVDETEIALQVCTAGNLRTTLLVADLLARKGRLDRLLVATDTPTGSGIMPLGMLYTLTHLCALGNMEPEIAIAAATGNNARIYGLNSGILAPRRDADVIILDACAGGSKSDALSAIRNGDIPAVAAVITDGVPRFVGRSRNTPAAINRVRVAESRIMQDFSGSSH
ncbi:amidohydrolase family protein [Rhodoligotrophos defluvii]|uniref:amidohydrolase family protein n=1 Tax=Rhodoligotrophos defluvii TaxID=2561934 RepID=UPI0010C9CD4E|nr:amidohydrolase family protein [Rhodoligotrophos defluvii]